MESFSESYSTQNAAAGEKQGLMFLFAEPDGSEVHMREIFLFVEGTNLFDKGMPRYSSDLFVICYPGTCSASLWFTITLSECRRTPLMLVSSFYLIPGLYRATT